MTSLQWARVQEGHLPRGLGRQTCSTSQEASSAARLLCKKDNESDNFNDYKLLVETLCTPGSINDSTDLLSIYRNCVIHCSCNLRKTAPQTFSLAIASQCSIPYLVLLFTKTM